MSEKNFFSCSDKFKSEYCCSVVRINELTPVEGSDFLAKTNIFGTQIVVRKDFVKEGDIMFYAANETALNPDFLSVNNLFEIGCRNMNANANEVNAIMLEYETKYKNEADKLRQDAKVIKSKMSKFEKQVNKDKKYLSKLNKSLESATDEESKQNTMRRIEEINNNIDKATNIVLDNSVKYVELKKKIDTLVNEGKPIVDKAKELCGFFNKYGRVRCIVLKNTPSFGFLFGIESMANFNPMVNELNMEDYIGTDFDTVDGELFVKAYVPPVKETPVRNNKNKRAEKTLRKFDRMIDGEFAFHYDTTALNKCIHLLNSEQSVSITVKRHGTSVVIGKVHVKNPRPMPIIKRIWNKIADFVNLRESLRFDFDYTVDYGPVYSSRSVIKNRYINNAVNSGYYNADIWSEYGDIVYPYLSDGMTIYGEICGYITGSDRMIQKSYPYECEKGENNLMIYRITTTDQNGKHEWNIQDVHDWTVNLIERMKEDCNECYEKIHPIDILYHGTLEDLYPDLDTENHWHENVLDRLQNDKEHFGMEDYEPMCIGIKVPREGIVIRIDDDPINEAFKLKTASFKLGEAVLYDDDNYQDIEVQEGEY